MVTTCLRVSQCLWVHPKYTWSRNVVVSPRSTCLLSTFHVGFMFSFLPANLMSSTYTDKNTTRLLYFWCFVSNSKFFRWQMSINDAKCTFLLSVLASSITSDLFLTFVRSNAGIFSSFSHSLSTASFAASTFIAWGTGISSCIKL